jgi:hypothetical protein
MDKVRVIEGSMRCFVCGWLSLVPVLGLAAGFVAIAEYLFIHRMTPGQWNPARKYLQSGILLSILGLLINGLPLVLLSGYIQMRIAEGSLSISSLFP